MQINLINGKAPFKQEWKEIGGKNCFFRSNWEYRYALYLQLMKENNHLLDWKHEPRTFWFDKIKRGTNNYKPDFCVIFPNGNEEWIEVKGFMDAKSMTKLKRMNKYYPEIKIRVVSTDWFKANGKTLSRIIKNW